MNANDATRRLSRLAALAVLCGVHGAHAQPTPHADPLALVGGRVLVKPGLEIDHATILIKDGVIVAVGPTAEIAVPAGVRALDASGAVITAGLIDPFGLVGLSEVDQETDANDGTLSPKHAAIAATFRAADAIDPFSMMRASMRAAGITAVAVAPRGVLVAGQAALSSMAAAATEPLVSSAALHVDLGPAATEDASRGRSIAALRDAFEETAAWKRNKAQYERLPHLKTAVSIADMRVLERALTGALPVVVRAHAVSDLRAAVALGREFGLRLVLAGATEAWLIADELAAAKISVILDPQDILPGRIDAPRVAMDGAVILRRAGVAVAFSTFGSPPFSAGLRHVAGIAVANGLPYADALAALTTVPAALYATTSTPTGAPAGASAARTKAAAAMLSGTLEVGARADIVVWTGDPFELSSWAKFVIIGGELQSTDTRQLELLRRYK